MDKHDESLTDLIRARDVRGFDILGAAQLRSAETGA